MAIEIEFIRDTREREGGPHKAGERIKAEAASAQRWLRRGAARLVAPTEADKSKAAAKPAEAEKKGGKN
ncbi:MAG TPA: hypothetical protein PLS90_14085 [Candidatus Sumerlaeota bacterium]|nr:hypothetical protein [Candidatus Sumerlaeota bacterium]HOK46109.1 hypothetical protein [Bryobacteraceae bacterium]HOR28896.1 hypothetical protein [Candidatus Sumerlaeota bacterium]HPK03573.1 hypothetical protein [Candidatus Sumerlaeota bacterium]